jgi:arsenate reductase
MKILILCTGNSCRSQIAQGFLQSFDSDLTVCSAGTEPSEKVNDKAVAVMNEVGIDISSAFPKSVNQYLGEEWDYVITVCGGANENCPMFTGHVKHRLHIGFDDPAAITGDEEFVMNEFRRIRNEIKNGFYAFYITEIKQQKLPTCSCND